MLSLTTLDSSVSTVFTSIALSFPDRMIYTEYLYVFNLNDPCCFQSMSQQYPSIIVICQTVSQSLAVGVYFRVLNVPRLLKQCSAERVKNMIENILLLLHYDVFDVKILLTL